jgi:hypothetical protein
MAEQQNGVSPASAGGASTPDPIGTVRAVNGVLFVLGTHPDYGRRWWPVEGGGQYEDGERWRQGDRPVVGAVPGTPAERRPMPRRPVYGEPGIESEWDEDAEAMRVDGIGWALSWGCKMSFAYDHDEGEHYVCVSTSDADQRAGITSRRTTKEQLASLGQQLVNVFGGPDPRDAEIERLRRELDALTLGANAAGRVRDALAKERDEAREEWKRADAEATRLKGELARANQAFSDLQSIAGQHQRAKQDAEAERDRLRAELDGLPHIYGRQIKRMNETQREDARVEVATLDQLAGELDELIETLKTETGTRVLLQRQRNEARAERDELETKLINVSADWELLRAELDRVTGKRRLLERALATIRGIAGDVDGVMNADTTPAEPRRWVAGDPEPEIGTTVRYVNDTHRPGFTRRTDGSWHCNTWSAHDPNGCDGESWTWERITSAATQMPLVEVVTTDAE